MFEDLTEQELLIRFALAWVAGALILMLLDYLGNNWPKRRFRPRGYQVPRNPLLRPRFRREVRAIKHEQIRQTIESEFGTPSLALSAKRRQAVDARFVEPTAPAMLALALPEDDDGEGAYWFARDHDGWGTENRERLAQGLAPRRWNPITGEEEFAERRGAVTAWPEAGIVDPFATDETAELLSYDQGDVLDEHPWDPTVPWVPGDEIEYLEGKRSIDEDEDRSDDLSAAG